MIYRSDKGSNLTADEVDGNFRELVNQINDILFNPPQANSIVSATQSGTDLYFQMQDGRQLGPISLPVLTFNFRGEYVPGALYAELDTFTASGYGLFSVRVAHTAPSSFDPNLQINGTDAYFVLMSTQDITLASLLDVDFPAGPADRDVLAFNATTGLWSNASLQT